MNFNEFRDRTICDIDSRLINYREQFSTMDKFFLNNNKDFILVQDIIFDNVKFSFIECGRFKF
ncbi:MAG: hypothetical protein ACRCX2_06605, partial [Paraclostridium sp.]